MYEVLNNLVVEMTRLAIDMKNHRMRVESVAARLDFDERRARALEQIVQFRAPSASGDDAPAKAGPVAAGDGKEENGGGEKRRRRRRRGRRRSGSNTAPAAETTTEAAASEHEQPNAPESPGTSDEPAPGAELHADTALESAGDTSEP